MASKETFLITGANGFVGGWLAEITGFAGVSLMQYIAHSSRFALCTWPLIVAMGAAHLVSNSATATIGVSPVNDAPVGMAETYSATEGTTVIRGSVLANDTDVDSPPASLYAAQFAASAGDPAVQANGSNSITTALLDGTSSTPVRARLMSDRRDGMDRE